MYDTFTTAKTEPHKTINWAACLVFPRPGLRTFHICSDFSTSM